MKDAFIDYFEELIGKREAEQFFCAIKGKRLRRGLRVNTLKASFESIKKWLIINGYEVENSEFSTCGLEIKGRGGRLSLKLPYHAGFTYPQDLASMFAVEMLDPLPGEKVLDLTAAPGGKTTHIAQKMENRGLLIANDIDSKRLKALHSNLERLGVFNVAVTRLTPYKFSCLYEEIFDRVLLDPSCSGEGLFVTKEGKQKFWNKKAIKKYAAEQVGLLCSAFSLLKPGGRLVYSTCTLNDIENDGVVSRLLKKFPDAEILEVEEIMVPPQISDLKGVRFWPHKTETRGFFCIAIGKKKNETHTCDPGNPKKDKVRKSMKDFRPKNLKLLNEEQLRPFSNYLNENFDCSMPNAYFTIRNNVLFCISKEVSDFDFKYKYSLSFPFLKTDANKIRPTHASALWLGTRAKRGVLNLSHDEAVKVFERRPVKRSERDKDPYPGTPQKIAVFENFPLGIAKIADGKIEVNLPKQF